MTRAERYRQKGERAARRVAPVRDGELCQEFLQLAEQYETMALDVDDGGERAARQA